MSLAPGRSPDGVPRPACFALPGMCVAMRGAPADTPGPAARIAAQPGAWPLLVLATSLSSALGSPPGLAVSLAAGWLGAALGGLTHELAHAVAARACGATRVRVVVGIGPGVRLRLPWPRLHWLSLHVRLCPMAGHARAHGPGLDRAPGAQAAIALAGPLASLGCAVALCAALTLPSPSPSTVARILHWSLFDGAVFSICGALQLLPSLGTDGSNALRALRAIRPQHAPATAATT